MGIFCSCVRRRAAAPAAAGADALAAAGEAAEPDDPDGVVGPEDYDFDPDELRAAYEHHWREWLEAQGLQSSQDPQLLEYFRQQGLFGHDE